MASRKTKEGRETHITVRLSNQEKADIHAAAERAGLMTGSYIRTRLIEGPIPRQIRRPPVGQKELARLLAETGKIGSNLNQLARAANSGIIVYGNEIEAALGELQVVRDAILRALGRQP